MQNNIQSKATDRQLTKYRTTQSPDAGACFSKAERDALRLAEVAIRLKRGDVHEIRLPRGARWTHLREKIDRAACNAPHTLSLTGSEIQMLATFLRLQKRKKSK